MVKDPVCGMTVDINKSAYSSENNGQTYAFCSAGCKRKFDCAPDQYRQSFSANISLTEDIEPAIDPVCGMKVIPGKAAATVHHGDTDFHFCGGGCAAKFRSDPDKYLRPKPSATPSQAPDQQAV